MLVTPYDIHSPLLSPYCLFRLIMRSLIFGYWS